MHKTWKNQISFCFLLLLAIWGCKGTSSNNTPPPPQVVLVEKSPDSAMVEAGIDAADPVTLPDPLKNGILLEWHPVNYEELEAYDIYRRAIDTTGNFQQVGVVARNFGNADTAYLDMTAGLDTTYYYFVRARSQDDQQGEPSRKDHYTLLQKPELRSPIGYQSLDSTFHWFFPGLSTQYFIFRIEKLVNVDEYEPYYVRLHELTAGSGGLQNNIEWDLSQIGLASIPPGEYRWRVDIRSYRDNRVGSESSWGYFHVP